MAVYFVGGAKLIKDIKSINAEIEILRSMEFGGVGRIEKYASSTPPQNTIKANGATLSRTTFARLWEYAQASGNLVDQASKDLGNFGTGDGSTTFTIPDHRGVAGRGFDDGAGLDSMPTLGRYQPDEIKAHDHTYSRSLNTAPISSGSYRNAPAGYNTQRTDFTGGEENTMKNVSFLYCIRYQ
ncbi:tail fiber protein [Marinomonas sp.]|uniref:tail fiber protein n=1 Tax=Marinomonas sp. TaxID=1904862 RepID=UPI003A915379